MAKHKTPNPAPITNGRQDSCTGMKSPEVIASKSGPSELPHDCDEDTDCGDGLYCFKRDEYEEVPGCQGKGNKGSDYCYSPDGE